jgi:hypothetical protein
VHADEDDDEWNSCKFGLKLLGFEQSTIKLFVGFCIMVLQRIHEVMQENMCFVSCLIFWLAHFSLAND